MNTYSSFEHQRLTDVARDDARRAAQRKIIDDHARKPERGEFAGYTISRYPQTFTVSVGLVLAVIALSAGLISGFRLYFAGRDYAALSISETWITYVIGISTVFAAEFMVILATVAAQVYMRGGKRGLAIIPVAVGMAVAFIGNWEVSQPRVTHAWGVIETLFPPVAVLSVAFFFEVSLMPELERRTADEQAFQDALHDYQNLIQRPDQHPDYKRYLARELWQAWVTAFQHEVAISEVPIAVRRQIVQRELRAESWLDDAVNSDEFSSIRSNLHLDTRRSGRSALQTAVDFLRENDDVMQALQAQTIQQGEIAHELGVSQSTISRAYHKVLSNGHGDTDHE